MKPACLLTTGAASLSFLSITLLSLAAEPSRDGSVTSEQVPRAIAQAVVFLKSRQDPAGSWNHAIGPTCLVTLALFEAGVEPAGPVVDRALQYIRRERSGATYVVALRTMALAAAREPQDLAEIRENVQWLTKAQMKAGPAMGMWGYNLRGKTPDNSNSQYALLGLWAADEVGVSVDPSVWQLARNHWLDSRATSGGWAYRTGENPTGSMTAAGISSLVITGEKLHEGREQIANGLPVNCGVWEKSPALDDGIAWIARNFSVVRNPGDREWLFYYLYGLERAGRLSGQRFFGEHDWYREGVQRLLATQDPATGKWSGFKTEADPVLATSFALLFLAKGRTPVVINKLKYGPGDDWQNDHHDVHHLTEFIGSRVWKRRLTWRIVDSRSARVEDFLHAPVLFFNGHKAPLFTAEEKRNLREYVSQGGFILTEACCGREEFDRGFRELIKELYPESDYELHLLPPAHPIWTAEFNLNPDDAAPLWGVDIGCRTSIVYSPTDLSCYWQQCNPRAAAEPAFSKPLQVGTNILSYATGRELGEKLAAREGIDLAPDKIERNSLQLAKIRHSGGWNAAPMALRNLAALLRKTVPLEVSAAEQELYLTDKNLPNYPLLYMHGRNDFTLNDGERAALKRHLTSGGVLFADACCGSEPFDRAFRRMIEQVFPDKKLQRIPPAHRIFTEVWHDLRQVHFNRPGGSRAEEPFLEGIELSGRYVVIYSKFDIGWALEGHQSADCNGYTRDDAVRIATNIVLYALMD